MFLKVKERQSILEHDWQKEKKKRPKETFQTHVSCINTLFKASPFILNKIKTAINDDAICISRADLDIDVAIC